MCIIQRQFDCFIIVYHFSLAFDRCCWKQLPWTDVQWHLPWVWFVNQTCWRNLVLSDKLLMNDLFTYSMRWSTAVVPRLKVSWCRF